jgi:hypothetical protein
LIAGVDLEDVDDQEITGFRSLNPKRPAQDMDSRERGITNIIRGVVVVDRPVEPLPAIRAKHRARLHADHRRNIWMPPIVPYVLLIRELLRVIQRKQILRHYRLLSA